MVVPHEIDDLPRVILLTEAQAAAALQVDKRTLRRLIESGRLKAVDISSGFRRHYRIDPADLRDMAKREEKTTTIVPRRTRCGRLSSMGSVHAFLPPA